jgi:hypothetical protein
MSETKCHAEITPRPSIEPTTTGLQIRWPKKWAKQAKHNKTFCSGVFNFKMHYDANMYMYTEVDNNTLKAHYAMEMLSILFLKTFGILLQLPKI